jgi:hypothetical protein
MFLRYTFTSRYKEILSKSHSSSVMTTPKFVPRLTREETLGKPNIACCTRSCSFAYSPIIPTRNLILFTLTCYIPVKCLNMLGNQWLLSRNGVLVVWGCKRHPSLAGRERQSCLMGLLLLETRSEAWMEQGAWAVQLIWQGFTIIWAGIVSKVEKIQ